jgi:hypothetical protein
LGSPALGTFAVAAGLKMCLFEEKAKTNDSFHVLALREVERASAIIESVAASLYAANSRAVSQFRSCRNVAGEGLFCIITVDGRTFSTGPIFDAESERQQFVDGLNNVTTLEIVGPAREIAATWKQLQ